MPSPNSSAVRLHLPIVVGCVCFLFLFFYSRYFIATHETLWTDEIWSLGIATGHVIGLSHGHAELGDYVELIEPMSLSYLRQFLVFNSKGHLLENIVRNSLYTDYNPPTYYLILNTWLSKTGISDTALRFLSVLFSLMTLPFIFFTAHRLGGKAAAFMSCFFFAFLPMSLYYSTEARVYALVILLSSILLWLTLLLPIIKEKTRPIFICAWMVALAVGLLTSSIFLSTAMACILWLVFRNKHFSIKYTLSAVSIALIPPLIWYIRVAQLSSFKDASSYCWSVSGCPSLIELILFSFNHLLYFFGGINTDIITYAEFFSLVASMILLPFVPLIVPVLENRIFNKFLAAFICLALLLIGSGELFVHVYNVPIEPLKGVNFAIFLTSVLCIMLLIFKKYSKDNDVTGNIFDFRLQLLYLNIFICILMPVFLDIVKKTDMSRHHRFCLSCFPAAIILAGIAFSRCQKQTQNVLILLILSLLIPFGFFFSQRHSRIAEEDYVAFGSILSKASHNDAILVDYCYSSSLLGLARYMPVDNKLIGRSSYNLQHDQEGDIRSILKGKSGVYLVRLGPDDRKNHFYEEWLKQNAITKQSFFFSKVDYCKYFIPKEGAVFKL